MQRSKALALVFLIGTLIVGVAAGFTADRMFVRDVCRNAADRRTLRDYLAQQLELTPAQRTAVDSILDKRHRDMSAVIAPVRPQLDSIRDAARGEIYKLLDARQRPRLERMIEESRQQEKKEHQ